MSRWKELPSTLDERQQQLVVQLRRLKDHSGLSLAALAAKTSYSRSSWERYLNGKKPAPRDAVEELARVCRVDPTRLLVLSDVAEHEREFAKNGPADAETAPEQPRSVRMVPVGRVLVGAAAAVVVAFGAGLLTGGVGQESSEGKNDTGTATVSEAGYRRGQIYPCEVERKNGVLQAGHSDTREILLDINSTGWDVVEAQCLLNRHGFDPGDSDGVYGERTKEAAMAFQKKRGLAVDGIVGPHTWGELRR